MEAKIIELEQQIANKNKGMVNYLSEISQLANIKSELERRLAKAEEKIIKDKVKLSELDKQLSTKKMEKINFLAEINQLSSIKSFLERQLLDSEKKSDEIKEKVSDLETQIQHQFELVDEITKEKQNKQEIITELKEIITELEGEVKKHARGIESYQQRIEQLLDNKLEEFDPIRKHLEDQIIDQMDKMEGLKELQAKKIEGLKEEYNKKLQEKEQMIDVLKDEHKSQLEKKEQEKKKVEDILERFQEDFSRAIMQKNEDIDGLREEYEKLLEEKNAEIKKIKSEYGAILSTKEVEIKALKERIEEIEASIAEDHRQVDIFVAEIEFLRTRNALLEKEAKAIPEIEKIMKAKGFLSELEFRNLIK